MKQEYKQITEELKAMIDREGGRPAAADKLSISLQYLNDILHERRGFSDKIAKKLGFAWRLVRVAR